MAIIPSVCKIESQNLSNIYFDDNVGIYNESCNAGGYGSPNENRSKYALAIAGYYKGYNKEPEVLTFTGNSLLYNTDYINSEVSRFTTIYNKDGYYDIYLFWIYNNGALNEGEVYYDENSGKVLKAISGGWVEVTNYLDLIGNSTVIQINRPFMMLSKTVLTLNKWDDNYLEQVFTGGCDLTKILMTNTSLERRIKGIYNQFKRGFKTEAQKNLEQLEREINC